MRNTSSLGRPALIVICLLVLTLATATASERVQSPVQAGPQIAVSQQSGSSVVLFEPAVGSPVRLHTADTSVSSPLLKTYTPANVLYASWDEATTSGQERLMTVSRDGGQTWSVPSLMKYEIPLRAGLLDPGVVAPFVTPDLESGPSDNLYIVQFDTVGLQAWRDRITALGAELLNPLPEHAHVVRMSAQVASQVGSESFVRWVGPYHPGYRIEPETIDAIRQGIDPDIPVRYRLQTFTPGPTEKAVLAGEIEALGGEIVLRTPNGYIVEASLTHDQVRTIAHSDHLLWLERWTPASNDMNIGGRDAGRNYIFRVGGYDGTGVVGEVFDAGVQMNPFHQDHDGIQLHGQVNVDSHGTSTYGIVFGNGFFDGDGDRSATGMIFAGLGWMADYDNVSDRYAHTAELIQAPIFAAFQSNSWGNTQTSAYTTHSMEIDDIIWINDINIFQSQSNLGNTNSRPQAWGKNIVAVGGIKHLNTLTTADDNWTFGGSIGPAQDGRIKPDLCYWYDSIRTTTSGSNGTAYTSSFGGTSAATPMVAGSYGAILQMWADNVWGTNPVGVTVFDRKPHQSTGKALLVNTAVQYTFSGATADLTRVHQGWGRSSQGFAYFKAPLTKVVDETDVLTELQTSTWIADVPAGQTELKVTMVYQDRAGTTSSSLHRINAVTLKVTSPGGTVYWGNNGLLAGNYSTPGGSANTIDTVQNVFLQNPQAGNWTIDVTAADINQDVHIETGAVDQDYALVVYPANTLTLQ